MPKETTLSLLEEAEAMKNRSDSVSTTSEKQEINNIIIDLYSTAIEFYYYESRTQRQECSVTIKIFDIIAHLKSLLQESNSDAIAAEGIKRIKQALKWPLKLTYNNEECDQETHRALARFFQQKEQPALALIHFHHACISNEHGNRVFNNTGIDYHLYYHELTRADSSHLQNLLQHQPPMASDHLLTTSLRDDLHSQIACRHGALAQHFENAGQPTLALAHWRLARDHYLLATTGDQACAAITDIIRKKLESSATAVVQESNTYYRNIKHCAAMDIPSQPIRAAINSQTRQLPHASMDRSATQVDAKASATFDFK